MTRPAAVPVRPTAGAISALRPLTGRVELSAGSFWGDWRAANTTASIPHAIGWMERAGYLDNLRRAAEGRADAYTGMHWMDSDLYKVLEAIGWDGDRPGSEANRAFLDDTVTLLERVQQEDGYLNSFFQTVGRGRRWTDFAFGHEMYLGGHLIQAGIAVARGLADDRLLTVGRRFADHLVTRFGTPDTVCVDGHPEVEMALVELYRQTGEQAYLDLARLLVDHRGHRTLGPGEFGLHYCQDDVPLREARELRGHAVRAVYLAAGATDVAVETGDVDLLGHLVELWDDLVLGKSYLTGGIGSRHFHEAIGPSWELPPDRAYAETCASIGTMMYAHRLLLATGDLRYADTVETVLYNGFAASTSEDRRHFWYRNPLHQREVVTAAPEGELLQERVEIGTRASWFGTACCPPNVMRTVASLDAYVAVRSEDTLCLTQLVDARVEAELPCGPMELEVASSLGSSGGISMHMRSAPAGARLAVRRPAWAEGVGGASLPFPVGETDRRIELGSSPRWRRASRRIDALRGMVAVTWGPVVYAVEGVDLADPADVSDLVLDPAVPLVPLEDGPLWAGLPPLRAQGALARVTAGEAYEGDREDVTVTPVDVVLRPYAGWANRGPTTMRVWVPAVVARG